MSSRDLNTRKTVNALVKGLVTESTDLTFPEDATLDELNCDLRINGERRRRKGLGLEAAGQYNPSTASKGQTFRVHLWERVGDVASLEFCVTQAGSIVNFYERDSASVSGSLKSFFIDLTNYRIANNNPALHPITVSNILGWLVITSPVTESLLVKYNSDLDTLEVSAIDFKVRDFKRQFKDTDFSLQPAELSTEYKYDLFNMGWDDAKITKFYDESDFKYPPRNNFWWSGKNSDGDFDPEEFSKVYSGNSFAGNGHYILDLFNKDRATASGISGAPLEVTYSRFAESAVFAGRVFFAGLNDSSNSSKIYFSNTVVNPEDIGLLYQRGDPTSEAAIDIVDSDGGEINIGGADSIVKLFPYGNSLMVFATNGVWEVKGLDGFFSASSYIIDKISDVGTSSSESIVDVEGTPFWWGKTAIYTASRNSVTGRPELQNLSLSTVQTFFEDIDKESRENCRGVFDKTDRIIYWMYSTTDTPEAFDSILVFNVNLGAFYPWRVNTGEGASIVGAFYNFPESTAGADERVFVGTDTLVADTASVVIRSGVSDSVRVEESQVKFFVFDETLGVSFAEFNNSGFTDWGNSYESFFETGYDFQGDLWQDKQCDGIVCYYTLTETGSFLSDQSVRQFVNPSSCLMQVLWDGATSSGTYKWSREYQTYRLRKAIQPTVDGDHDFGYSKVKTLTRIRGRGDSMRIRFRSEDGKDFRFQGYEAVVGKPKTHI